jgi:hypothetical protein
MARGEVRQQGLSRAAKSLPRIQKLLNLLRLLPLLLLLLHRTMD